MISVAHGTARTLWTREVVDRELTFVPAFAMNYHAIVVRALVPIENALLCHAFLGLKLAAGAEVALSPCKVVRLSTFRSTFGNVD
jgi:hypothetical protein